MELKAMLVKEFNKLDDLFMKARQEQINKKRFGLIHLDFIEQYYTTAGMLKFFREFCDNSEYNKLSDELISYHEFLTDIELNLLWDNNTEITTHSFTADGQPSQIVKFTYTTKKPL